MECIDNFPAGTVTASCCPDSFTSEDLSVMTPEGRQSGVRSWEGVGLYRLVS